MYAFCRTPKVNQGLAHSPLSTLKTERHRRTPRTHSFHPCVLGGIHRTKPRCFREMNPRLMLAYSSLMLARISASLFISGRTFSTRLTLKESFFIGYLG